MENKIATIKGIVDNVESGSAGEILKQKIARRTAVVGVCGIGYVGLPLAVEKAKVGFTVVGYDRNAERVAMVNEGRNYIADVDDGELAGAVGKGLLRASTDFSTLAECDIICICVPTPLTKNLDPDVSYIRNVGAAVARTLRPGQLVSLESTTYPGTTEEVLLPMFAERGLVVGRDFFLCFSPERVDPGNKRYTTKNTNKVVGGVTRACLELGSAFYSQTIIDVVPVSSPRVAEMTKIFENTFRAVNIALVNEMTLLCDRLGIKIWDVVDAASTKPFGIMRFEPGPGVGGHCIPLDPFYLAWKAREYDFHVRFIELAGEINRRMPYFVREKILRVLNDAGRALKDARILAIGVAYKKDIDDWRESPAIRTIELLEEEGAFVDYYDPFVPSVTLENGATRHCVALDERVLSSADCVVILTDHSNIDYDFVVANARRIVDTRNATRNVKHRPETITLL